jgi:N6-L-threonylcarbamoyladenine synthase
MPTILGIESTCDETAAAIVVDGTHVRSNVIASQVDLHAKYRGVVPEIASRAHIENILPVIRESLQQAACAFADLDAIAVAHRPGLIGSLLVGVTAAKTLAWSLSKPLIAVDHVQAHLYSVLLRSPPLAEPRPQGALSPSSEGQSPPAEPPPQGALSPRSEGQSPPVEPRPQGALSPHTAPPEPPPHPQFPAVGLVVSGGHTSLYKIQSWTQIQRLGGTIDDAVGEAYDKVAAILGLGYPGGPFLDQLAKQGNPTAIKFPRTLLSRDSLDFSFSGLKTAVLYHVRGVPGKPPRTEQLTAEEIRDIAASFQAACVDVLLKKLDRAVKRIGAKSIIIGGGVSANAALRTATQKLPIPVHIPLMPYTTDNAAMTAGLAHVMLQKKITAALDLDAITYSAIR